MKRLCTLVFLLFSFLVLPGTTQSPKDAFPTGVFAAKTVAIINDTRTPGVEKGAAEALASWGQFKIVSDPQLAEITLRFEKTRQHEGRDTQKTDDDGKNTSYGYSMSFESTIAMRAFFKDADTPFYSTKTEDSKNKAGTTCVNSFHTAYRTALQQNKP